MRPTLNLLYTVVGFKISNTLLLTLLTTDVLESNSNKDSPENSIDV